MKRLIAIVAIAFLSSAAPAHAAAYEYWSYFHSDGTAWAMSMEGATFVPADGSVEGWRYVKTSGDELAPNPRVAPDFASLCAAVPEEAGKKRVGLVVDFGTVAPADEADTLATCVSIEESADGFSVLQAATTIASDSGMVSCIQGVPSATCEAVPALATTTAAENETTPSSSSPLPILLGVLAIGAIVVAVTRRRKG